MAQWALLSFHTRGRRCSETSNDLLRFRSWPGGHGAAPGGLSLEPAVLAGPLCSPTSQQSHLCSHQPPSVYSALGCALLVSDPTILSSVTLFSFCLQSFPALRSFYELALRIRWPNARCQSPTHLVNQNPCMGHLGITILIGIPVFLMCPKDWEALNGVLLPRKSQQDWKNVMLWIPAPGLL